MYVYARGGSKGTHAVELAVLDGRASASARRVHWFVRAEEGNMAVVRGSLEVISLLVVAHAKRRLR